MAGCLDTCSPIYVSQYGDRLRQLSFVSFKILTGVGPLVMSSLVNHNPIAFFKYSLDLTTWIPCVRNLSPFVSFLLHRSLSRLTGFLVSSSTSMQFLYIWFNQLELELINHRATFRLFIVASGQYNY